MLNQISLYNIVNVGVHTSPQPIKHPSYVLQEDLNR